MNISDIYEQLYENPDVRRYHQKHDTRTMQILLVIDEIEAKGITKYFLDFIRDKVVIEIGAGIGLLSCEMAKHAKQVYAIESDPAWSWQFTQTLYREKPPNLTWVFGRAESVMDWLRGDVVIIYSHSNIPGLTRIGYHMAPIVVSGPQSSSDGGSIPQHL